ncbi:hypothetical protein [Poseidonibacter sp.]|uniref:hypothetical protein n=1 Tax=Poseidonibacter sp. TaxID=2321188 RepID=UPI003C76B4A8
MEDATINSDDYKQINQHSGYSIGFNSEVIFLKNLDTEIIERLNDYLPQAKGALIKFLINKEQSMLSINDTMEKLTNSINSECEIIFGTEIKEDIKLDECKFNIYITGLGKI